MTEGHDQLKSIFEYDDYRVYLKAFYRHFKATDRKFSFRYFSKQAGFSSPSFLKQVMEGLKNLSENGIEKFANALKLNKEERQFFKNLVLLNQASTIDEKQIYSKEILRSRTYRKLNPLRESQHKLLSKWYFLAIKELVSLPDFKEDPQWISKQLIPHVKPAEVQGAIEMLIDLGLLIRNEKGDLAQADKDILVPDQISSNFLAQCHQELIKKAGESIDLIPSNERQITAVTFKVSKQNLEKIKEILANVRNDVREAVSHHESPDSVYQLNLQLFPLAGIRKESS